MPTTAVQVAAIATALAATAAWAAVATAHRPFRSRAWLLPAVAATGATLLYLFAVVVLWSRSWWFAAEHVTVSAPLATLALAWFAVSAFRDVRTRSVDSEPTGPTRAAAWASVATSVTAVFAALVVGAPFSVWTAIALALLAVGGAAIAAIAVRGRASRRPIAVVGAGIGAVLAVSMLLVGVGLADPGPLRAAVHSHGAEASGGNVAAPAQGFPGMDAAVPVTELRETSEGSPDVSVTLEARAGTHQLPSRAEIDAWTFGGRLGGTPIEATQGDLVEVRLRNIDIDEGVTLHWHGYAVPNGDDGVAGVTQDAVAPGDEFVYRFVADDPGTYWYHTHQAASEGVVKGLYGSFIVHPADGERADVDAVALLHTYGARLVIGSSDEAQVREVAPGSEVRVRLVNTDQITRTLRVSGAPFRVLAIDGADIEAPGELSRRDLPLPAGGRIDIGFEMSEGGVRIDDSGSRSARLEFTTGEGGSAPEPTPSAGVFDPLSYGEGMLPAWASGPFDVSRTVVLDRLPRLTTAGPAYAYTIDGAVFPQVPATVVREGDTVELTIVNRGFETHPMHPHGHRVLVLEVDGRRPAGPLWLDSFDVRPGQVWRVALVADNPGIWMDHCHNLEHAALGMVSHLAYERVVSPFDHGGETGNSPE